MLEFILALALALEPIDGDSIKIKDTVKGTVVSRWRLAYIDAPELKQPDGEASKAQLNSLIKKNLPNLSVTDLGKDYYGRRLVVLKGKKQEINLEMCVSGYAWSYENRKGKYLDAQLAAKKAKRGIWKGNPEEPWKYRARTKHTYILIEGQML